MSLLRRRLLMAAMAKKDYITDGLILRLDAIKNTPQGHSNDTEVWYDLSPNGNNATLTNCVWGDKHIMFQLPDLTIGYGDFGENIVFGNINIPTTVEIVADFGNGGWGTWYHKFLSRANDDLRNVSGAAVSNGISVTASHLYLHGSYGEGIRFSYIRGQQLVPSYFHHTIAMHLDYADNIYRRAYRNGGGSEISSVSGYEDGGNLLSNWNTVFNYRYVSAPSQFYALRLYDRLLTVEEIKHNAKLDKERFNL